MNDKAFNDYLVCRMAAYITRWPVAEGNAAAAAAAPTDANEQLLLLGGGALTGTSSSRPPMTKRSRRKPKEQAETRKLEPTTRVWYHMWYHDDVISYVISHMNVTYALVMSYCDVICFITLWYGKMNVISPVMCILVVYDITCDVTIFCIWYHIIEISHVTSHVISRIYTAISYMISHMISYSDCEIIHRLHHMWHHTQIIVLLYVIS